MIRSSIAVVTWVSLHVIVSAGSPAVPPAAWQEPRGATQQVFGVSGVVDDVDRVGRNITIKSAGVIQSPIYVGPDLPIFDQLNRGDTVSIRFYDSVIVAVTPNAPLAPLTNTTAEAKRALDRADADVMQQTTMIVTVDAIDATNRVVNYHGFDNRPVMRQVQHPQLIEGLKVGDVVTITYTRARAAAIEKGR